MVPKAHKLSTKLRNSWINISPEVPLTFRAVKEFLIKGKMHRHSDIFLSSIVKYCARFDTLAWEENHVWSNFTRIENTSSLKPSFNKSGQWQISWSQCCSDSSRWTFISYRKIFLWLWEIFPSEEELESKQMLLLILAFKILLSTYLNCILFSRGIILHPIRSDTVLVVYWKLKG